MGQPISTSEATSGGRVIFLSTHVWRSRRRAGFHWVADSFWRHGWNVYFLTDCLSPLDGARHDYRLQSVPPAERNRLVQEDERLHSYLPYMSYRPMSLRSPLLDRLTYSWFARWADRVPLCDLEEIIPQADLIVFESSSVLMLFDRFRRLNPTARFVYRVSDEISLFNTHPIVLDVERRIAPQFDLISVPYQAMLAKFSDLTPRLAWHPHGVPTHLFDEACPNPFAGLAGPHAVFSGVILFDVDFLRQASELFPQVQFHIIGPHERTITHPNVHYYGEIPYLDTIPFVTHADLGLQCTLPKGGMGSNKAMIYTYCRLPMVASLGNETRDWPHVFIYTPGDAGSIASAMRAALAFDRSQVPADEVTSWDDVASSVLGQRWDL